MFWQCFRPWACDIYWAADATTQRLAQPGAGKTCLLSTCVWNITTQLCHSCSLCFLQYSIIFVIDTNDCCLLPTLLLILFLNKAHHTHPGSLWQLITKTLQPSKNNQLPVLLRYKHAVWCVTYPWPLLTLLCALSPFKVGDLRTGKLSRPLSWADWAL